MLRALPAMVRTAASRSAAVRSGCFIFAISSACLRVSLPTLSVCGVLLPFSILSALRISTDAGGDFRMNVKLLSAYAVITTGSIRPGSTFCVWALNALQNSMMFRPRWPSAGPMGGEGFALPAGTWSLIRPTIFFATRLLLRVQPDAASRRPPRFVRRDPPGGGDSSLLYLSEIQFHRRRAPEDQHRDADLALLVVHFLDVAVEVGERSFGHAHRFADLEQHLRFRLLDAFLHLVQDVLDFLVRDRRGPHRRAPDESGHLRRALHQETGLVGHVLLLQDVAGEEAALADRLLPALHLDHFLGGHQHLAELLGHARAPDALHQGLLDALLLPGVGVHHVPAHRHGHPPVPRTFWVTQRSPVSTSHRKSAIVNTNRNTTPVV